MTFLQDKEVEFIRGDLKKKGIRMPGLDHDLLDHLLCSVENYSDAGNSFLEAYQLALKDLNNDQEIKDIQQETAQTLNQGKSILKNLLVYGVFIGLLIGIFNVFTNGINPALILICISLAIFFVYHSVFFRRKQKSERSNLILFSAITLLPVISNIIFMAEEFPEFRLIGTPGWSFLIIFIAIPIYYRAVRKILSEQSTLTRFLVHILQFISLASLIWVPLALCTKLFRPNALLPSFLDDLVVLSLSCFLLSIGVQRLSFFWSYLRRRF